MAVRLGQVILVMWAAVCAWFALSARSGRLCSLVMYRILVGWGVVGRRSARSGRSCSRQLKTPSKIFTGTCSLLLVGGRARMSEREQALSASCGKFTNATTTVSEAKNAYFTHIRTFRPHMRQPKFRIIRIFRICGETLVEWLGPIECIVFETLFCGGRIVYVFLLFCYEPFVESL